MSRNSGYALVTLMIMVAVLLVSLTAALPSVYQAGQREREEEAIFRGNQYARAVYLYYRSYGRYPTSVKDLLNTGGTRFLREPYRDPLSRDGRWRFIHAVSGGVLVDSWNQTTLVPGVANGAASAPGSAAANNSSSMGAASNNTVAPTSAANAGNEANGKPKHPPSTCDEKGNNSPDQSSDTSYQTGTLMGAFIVGVAPCNSGQSIRVLDHQDHYDHWEFIGINYREYALPKSSSVGNTPTSPGSMGPPNQPGPMGNPAGTNGSNGSSTPGPGGSP
ncbi:MAG TPA: hypothetical protein VGY31_03590 [Terriglobia bacterium]|nr:hypothetical protein [Terriglobia bacterium]